MSHTYSFEKLEAWKNARSLAKAIYVLSSKFSNSEKFGLASQIQRAAVSVSSNIAEGSGRNSPKEKIRFIEIAYGSLMETYNQLLIAIELTYITEESVEAIKPSIDAVAKMINALHNKYVRQLNEG